jgi:hypothetical protein
MGIDLLLAGPKHNKKPYFAVELFIMVISRGIEPLLPG